jgi:class 3 adenylate cyclase/uncharacterized protein YaaN involved in tellurite resistance
MAPTRRLTAVLAADVAGYSRLMGADEEGTHERLRAHLAELVYPKIEEHRGRVVKDTGDGLLAEFASVVDAVRCAVEMQRGMSERNALVPADSRIEFRVGINLGDVIAEKHDIFGDGVNIAARLEALAEPGGICVSRVVRDQVRDRLDCFFEDLGHQSVKNIARPVRVYAWRLEAPADPPPLDVPDVPPIPQSPDAPRLPKASMPNAESTPLDLAAFDDLDTLTPELVEGGTASLPVPASSTALERKTEPERLVEVSNLKTTELAAAHTSAAKIDFGDTNSLLSHGEGAMAAIAQSSRQLLTGTRLGDAGEVGRIAASVIDGVKILRIEDLQAEANSTTAARKGFVARLIGFAADAHSAFKGFAENRKRFLDLMDEEQARARKIKADLSVAVELMDQQAAAIRQSLHALKIEIAAGQIALDRGYQELEAQRQKAVQSGEAADAADVMEMRSALANFRGKIADMRESLVGSATLVPIIGQNRKAAETRIMKISDGLLVVIPRLMAVASQAAVQVDIARAAKESEKLDDAARQITILASKGAREAATSAARSLGGDARNVEVLAQVADEAIRTMQEVMQIEREVAAGDRQREANLATIRDRLISGMRDVHAAALQQ